MAGVRDDLDASGGNGGAEHVEVGCGLALAHGAPLALLVGIGRLQRHDRHAQAGQRGRQTSDIVTLEIEQQLLADRRRQSPRALDDRRRHGLVTGGSEHVLEHAVDQRRVAVRLGELRLQDVRHGGGELAAVDQDDA